MRFARELAACRLGGAPDDDGEDFDDSGRDTRCAICRDEMCACGNVYDCEHDTDQRHGWAPLLDWPAEAQEILEALAGRSRLVGYAWWAEPDSEPVEVTDAAGEALVVYLLRAWRP